MRKSRILRISMLSLSLLTLASCSSGGKTKCSGENGVCNIGDLKRNDAPKGAFELPELNDK